MINRSGITIKAKEKFWVWYKYESPEGVHTSLNALNSDTITYLIDPEIIDTVHNAKKWVTRNRKLIALSEFVTRGGEKLPKSFSIIKFDDWFSWEYHSIVYDRGIMPLKNHF